MKKRYIRLTTIIITLTACISALSFANDISLYTTPREQKKDDNRKSLEKKVEEFNRIQNAIQTIEKSDTQEFDTWFSTQEAAVRATNLTQDLNTIISDIEKIQQKRKENNDNYKEIMKQISRVIIDIKVTNNTVNESVVKMNLLTKRMITMMAKLDETRDYLDNTREAIIKILPSLYMMQNAYTNQAWSIDDLKLLLGNNEALSTTLSFDDMVHGLSIKLDGLLVELSEAEKKYTSAIRELHDTRKEMKETILLYREKINTLEEQRAYLLDFLSLYKWNKIKFDKNIKNIFETRTQLLARIQKTVIEAQEAMNTTLLESWSVYKEFYNMKDDREKRPNMFSWPILPIESITTFFGWTITIWWNDEVYSGLQIVANQGQEVYSLADWIVYYVQDQNGIGTNWVAIIHKNGYISVFTNLQRVFPKAWTIVDRWELIGLVGWQPWTRWAWRFSSQPMLNMQLFKDGKAIDPLTLLDLSVINNPSILPENYQTKYDADLRSRSSVIDFTDIKFMEWNSVRERRLKFLDTVAAWPYDSIVLWESAAEWTNVDVDLGICIWFAETSMWRHFASENNIWNVWNNDRGDRVDKDSPLDWAKAIYNVLNNRFLWGYRTIYELSWYGNKDWAIYASSEYNWQKNVSRCLSMIKWYIVPEDFPFRTYWKLVD